MPDVWNLGLNVEVGLATGIIYVDGLSFAGRILDFEP